MLWVVDCVLVACGGTFAVCLFCLVACVDFLRKTRFTYQTTLARTTLAYDAVGGVQSTFRWTMF